MAIVKGIGREEEVTRQRRQTPWMERSSGKISVKWTICGPASSKKQLAEQVKSERRRRR